MTVPPAARLDPRSTLQDTNRLFVAGVEETLLVGGSVVRQQVGMRR